MSGLKLLIILREVPGSAAIAREHLDLIMACGAFIPETTVLFQGPGRGHLRTHFTGDYDHQKALRALAEYGLDKLYLHADNPSGTALWMRPSDLPLQLADTARCRELVRSHDHVITL